ncbi:MAG: hypothetical protein MJ078_01895, partial [Clostridia bacterium]|nr:hypothetical protein [Clostridia bacterium]
MLIRTVTESMYFDLKDGKRIASYDAYDILSRHYGLDLVDVGAELISRCQAGEGEPLHGYGIMHLMARAAVAGGAVGIRALYYDIPAIKAEVDVP